MRDHEIFAITWSDPHVGDTETCLLTSAVIDVGPEVIKWRKRKPISLEPKTIKPTRRSTEECRPRVVNRTDFYRCKEARLILVK